MNRRGTKVGPRDPVAAELRRQARYAEGDARVQDACTEAYAKMGRHWTSLEYARGISNGLRKAALRLTNRAKRLERAARKVAR